MLLNYHPDSNRPLTTAFPYFPPEEQAWLQSELSEILNGQLAMGPRVAEFERGFARFCGVNYGIAFPSCTSALEAALVSLGLRSGEEVLVPSETFIATAMAVSLAGGVPIFTEVCPNTFSMDFEDALSRMSEKTRGAIVVHFGGLIAPDFPDFVKRMQHSGRFVIEDAAHAHGAELGDLRAGGLADAGCFSFYPTKIMTTGEGGMLVTSRDDVARVARSLQHRGRDFDAAGEHYCILGRNNRFTEIAAAMGLSQLRCLPGFLEQRRRLAAVYNRCLNGSQLFSPVGISLASVSSYWRYIVILHETVNRKNLRDRLAEESIAIDWPYDPPLHLQPVFRELRGTRPGMLPISESLLTRHVCLPMHARLREEDAEYIVDRLCHHGSLSARLS